jgi:hypothetical protein
MAKIEKLKKYIDGVLKTIYPATIPQAVIDPNSGKTVRTELNERMGISEEEVIATDLNALSERVSALEAAFRNMIISKMQVDSIDVLKDLNYQGRPLFIVSNVAPAIIPDGVPQFYIDTATGDFYSAKNNTSVNDWILK